MRNFLMVDFEFTNYNRPVGRPSAYFSEVIEIGAVLLDGETFKVFSQAGQGFHGFLHDNRKGHEKGR